jgi:hypothetical protein
MADSQLERPAFLFASEHMVDWGSFNTGTVICPFIAVLEVFINLPVMQDALRCCGDHPVVDSIRKLLDPRRGSARVGPLLEPLCSEVPRPTWRPCSWVTAMRVQQ